MTPKELKEIMPFSGSRGETYAVPLAEACERFCIDTAARKAAFIAQIAHESGSLRYTEEIASGKAYEGRVDLGNTEVGDGVRFKGRGLMQITGRANYKKCGEGLGVDLIKSPELLKTPQLAAASAAWFWKTNGLNALAEKGEFDKITRRINGGTNGSADRRNFWATAKRVLGV